MECKIKTNYTAGSLIYLQAVFVQQLVFLILQFQQPLLLLSLPLLFLSIPLLLQLYLLLFLQGKCVFRRFTLVRNLIVK